MYSSPVNKQVKIYIFVLFYFNLPHKKIQKQDTNLKII